MGGKFFFEFGLGLVQPFRCGHLYGDSLAGIVAGQPFQLGEPGRGRKLFILDGAGCGKRQDSFRKYAVRLCERRKGQRDVLLPVFFTLVGLGDASRVLLIALTTGYQVLVIIRAGALSIDPSWVKAFRSMGGTTAEAVRHLYVPAALPALFTSLKVASGTAVAVLFLAESFATTSGLGYLIMDAWGMGDVLSMFNAILGMSLLGLVIYGVIGLLERVCCPWLFAGRR